MTVSDVTISQLSAEDARALTVQIHGALEIAWDLIVQAYQGRAWSALGYRTWDEYCKAEFNGSQLRLPREERQEVVHSLREAGMSTRAIASATGQSHVQVQRDMASGGTNVPPDEDAPKVTGMDGKTYEPKRPPISIDPTEDDEVLDAEIVDDEPAPQKTDPRQDRRLIAFQVALTQASNHLGQATEADIGRLTRLYPENVSAWITQLTRIHEFTQQLLGDLK